MGFPNWTFHESFEGGDKGSFDTESDAAYRLSVKHISELAQSSAYLPTPLRGAYAAVVDFRSGTSTAAYFEVTNALDVTAGASATLDYALSFMITPDMEANHDGYIEIVQVAAGSASGDLWAHFSDTDGWRIGLVTDGAGLDEDNAMPFELGEFVHVAVHMDVVGSTGTAQLWVNGERAGAGHTGIDYGNVTLVRIGVNGQSSDVKGGLLVVDEFIGETGDERPFPLGQYDPEDGTTDPDPIGTGKAVMIENGHVGIGGATLDRIVVVGSPSSPIHFYDTDRGQRRESTFEYACSATPEGLTPLPFANGIYAYCEGWNGASVLLEFDEDIEDREELAEYAKMLRKPSDDD